MADQLRRDIARARDRLAFPLGAGREFRNLESYLWPGEHVDVMCVGQYNGGRGLLVLTQTRVLFLFHGFTGHTSEDFPLDRINSIQWNTGWLAGSVSIFSGGNTAEVRLVARQDGKAFADRVRTVIAARGSRTSEGAQGVPRHNPLPVPPPPPSAPAGWYPDPHNGALQRYWDGTGWSDHTAPLTS